MTALDLLHTCTVAGPDFQLHINDFVDTFRRASPEERATMVAEGPATPGRMEGLVIAGAPVWLSEATRTVLANGLGLLGVSAPDRM